jgi:hypothetical protein
MREIGIILIASFAIDRVVTGFFFLLSFNPDLRSILEPDSVKDPDAKAEAQRVYRLIYAIFAGYLGTIVFAGEMGHRLSSITGVALNPKAGDAWGTFLDILLTGLLLAGGADRLADAMKLRAGREEKQPKTPIEITGKVVLEQAGAKTYDSLPPIGIGTTA